MALTAEEQAELNSMQPAEASGGLTPEEQAEMEQLHSEGHGVMQMAGTAMNGVGRVMDYLGGNVRNAVAQGADLKDLLRAKLEGREPAPITKEGDTIRALKGDAPRSADYMERMGIPSGASASDLLPMNYSAEGKGFSLKKGGPLDPSVRGVAGFVGDQLLDPLTYLSGGLSAVAKGGDTAALKALLLANDSGLNKGGKVLNAVLNPVESLSRSGSTSAYNKAFERAQAKVGETPESLASVAQKTGFYGSPQSAAEHFQGIKDTSGKGVGDTLSEAAKGGAVVDSEEALKPVLEEAARLKKLGTPEADSVAAQMEARVKQLKDTHGPTIPVDIANDAKAMTNRHTNWGNSADSVANEAKKGFAEPLAAGVKKGVADSDKELYQRLLDNSKRYSSVADAPDALQMIANQVPSQKGPLGGSQVDAMLAGMGAMGAMSGHESAMLPFLAKKAGQSVMSFEGRTARGALLNKIGQGSNGITDEALRQLYEKLSANKSGEQ